MSINNQRGTSLIEILVATFLMTAVVVSLSLAFPVTSKNIAKNRQAMIAADMANSYIAKLQSQPYAYVDTTNTASFPLGNSTCDCTALDLSVLPGTSSNQGGTTYQLISCANFVNKGSGNTWTPQCPESGDTGYKNVLVRVFWTAGTTTQSVSQQSSLTR